MPKALTTIGIVLKFGLAPDTLEELCKIKTFPQLGGERERIETTDLRDTQHTYVPGVQEVPTISFEANFTIDKYLEMQSKAMIPGYFELHFGKHGGGAMWQGKFDTFVNEGEVNGLVECTVVVYPATELIVLEVMKEVGNIEMLDAEYSFEDTTDNGNIVVGLDGTFCDFSDAINDGTIIITVRESEDIGNG